MACAGPAAPDNDGGSTLLYDLAVLKDSELSSGQEQGQARRS